MNCTETKKFGKFEALNNSAIFFQNDCKPSLKMSERLEPQNFRKDGSLGFGGMGVPPYGIARTGVPYRSVVVVAVANWVKKNRKKHDKSDREKGRLN